MTDPQFERLEKLFRAAQLHPVDERQEFVDSVCGDDPELKRELEALIQAHDEAVESEFLGEVARESVIDWIDDGGKAEDTWIGRQIGPYTIVKTIGQGGMGNVFMAERREPYRQLVAIKLLRESVQSEESVRRFDMERQILASLSHPNIAQLLDGGKTEDEVPYLVLEYVEGVALTEYCDAHRLDLQKRLRLFLTVCRAVQYAHQNLIIHRDLKPSNILVMASGEIKLLDFGIAKLINPQLANLAAPVTRTEFRVMTPEYASPEQIRSEPLSTATDVYALGVVLYELLTGHKPYRLDQRAPHEMARIVCEQDPQRPSVVVAREETLVSGDGTEKRIDPEEVAAARDLTVGRLQRSIKGDLDNIVLKALRKEAALRYGSAENLAIDVTRHLDGQPVGARPQTIGYKVRKFVERNRLLTAVSLAASALMIFGIAALAWQSRQMRAAYDHAELARLEAEETLERSEAIGSFLTGLIGAGDPFAVSGSVATTEDLLDQAVARVDGLSEQPRVQAHLLRMIGNAFYSRGLLDKAEPLLQRALALHRSNLVEARRMTEEIEEEDLGELRAELSDSLLALAQVYHERGEHVESEALYREALTLRRQVFGDDHLSVTEAINGLAALLGDVGEYEEALVITREGLEIQRRLGRHHKNMGDLLYRLGSLLRLEASYEEAVPVLRESIDVHRIVWGSEHPSLARAMGELSNVYYFLGDYQAAEPLIRESLAMKKNLFGDDHLDVAADLRNLSRILSGQGRLEEAEEAARESVAILARLYPGDHIWSAAALEALAMTLVGQQQFEEAEAAYFNSLGMQARLVGEEHPGVARSYRHLAHLEMARGRSEAAYDYYQRSLAIFSKRLGDQSPLTKEVREEITDLEASGAITQE